MASVWLAGALGWPMMAAEPPGAPATQAKPASSPAPPGNVYLAVGSDTAIWNFGGTVDVYSAHPYYPQGFFTDPASPAFQVMDSAWRAQFRDSYGQAVKFTWWMMGGNIYREAVNQNVPIPNTMVLHLMKQYHGEAIRRFGDELSLHYHTFLWSDYDGDGNYHWNQARTFQECREDFDLTLAQYLLEEEVFPVSFRSGWHFMDNEWQQYLDELLPFSMHNNWPAWLPWNLFEPINNVQDWSRAPSTFVPYHPAPGNYQLPGPGTGWDLRSIKMQNLAQSDLEGVFVRAAQGEDQVVCIWNHLPENFIPNFARIHSLAQTTAANHPDVKFRYCTAVEAMQRWLGAAETAPPEIEVSEAAQGQTVTLTIHTSQPLFQPRPFVALRDACQRYANLTAACVPAGSNTWSVILPVPRNTLAKVGIAATGRAGHLATRILRYLPDDLYLDNRGQAYAELEGNWSATATAAWGVDARIAPLAAGDTARVRWTLPVSRSGVYRISAQAPALANGVGNIAFNLFSGGSHLLAAAFAAPLPDRQWVELGNALLDPGRTNFLELTVRGADPPGGCAVADVIRIVPLPDTNAPIITCPPDIVIDCATGNETPVAFEVSVSDDGDPHPLVLCLPASGSRFPLGTTLVRCLATDASGNSSSGSFAVTVRDPQPPVITWMAGVALKVDADCQARLPDLTDAGHLLVADACADFTVTQSVPPNTALGIGIHPVALRVSDAAGKVAYATNHVVVQAAAPPVILRPPQSRTNFLGTTAVFQVEARSCGPIACQWRRGAVALAGETNATLAIANVRLASAGLYSVILANTAGQVASAAAELVVVPSPGLAPNELALAPLPTGFRLWFPGPAGQACDVQRTADLRAGWTTLATIRLPPGGVASYTDASPRLAAAFYRVARRAD